MSVHTETITVRLPATEVEAVRERAEELGLSVAQYARRMLTGGGAAGVSAAVESSLPADAVSAALARRYAAEIDLWAGTMDGPKVLAQLGPKLTALAVGAPSKAGAPATTPQAPAEPTSGDGSALGALRDEVAEARARRVG